MKIIFYEGEIPEYFSKIEKNEYEIMAKNISELSKEK